VVAVDVVVDVEVLVGVDDGSPKASATAIAEPAMKRLRWEMCCAALIPAGFPGAKTWGHAGWVAKARQIRMRGARDTCEG